jgi:hypothetical protein
MLTSPAICSRELSFLLYPILAKKSFLLHRQ